MGILDDRSHPAAGQRGPADGQRRTGRHHVALAQLPEGNSQPEAMGGDRVDPGWRLPGRIQLMPGHSEFSVRWFASATQIAGDLWETCFPLPLEGQWWYVALENSRIEDQFRFAYMQIERSGEPVGIAPVFFMDVPIDLIAPPAIARILKLLGAIIRAARYQRTLSIGSVCADEGTVGLTPGVSLSQVGPIIQHAADERARIERCNMTV